MSYPRLLIWSEKETIKTNTVFSFAVRVDFTGKELDPFRFTVIRKEWKRSVFPLFAPHVRRYVIEKDTAIACGDSYAKALNTFYHSLYLYDIPKDTCTTCEDVARKVEAIA